MPDLAPAALHDHLLAHAPRILRFDPDAYFPEWQSAARRSFKQLLGLMPGKVDLDLRTLAEHPPSPDRPYHAVEFLFKSESHVDVPCELRLPPTGSGPFPTLILLADTPEAAAPFTAAALRNNHAVLLFPLRNTGPRRSAANSPDAALVALLVGRTMLGQRVWDVTRAIDALAENIPAIDASRLSILGTGPNAGLTAYAAAAIDSRLTAAIILDGIAPFASLGQQKSDAARYLPNIMHYFEIADLAGLITPRPLLLATDSPELLEEIRTLYTAQKVPTAFVPIDPNTSAPQLWTALQNLTTDH